MRSRFSSPTMVRSNLRMDTSFLRNYVRLRFIMALNLVSKPCKICEILHSMEENDIDRRDLAKNEQRWIFRHLIFVLHNVLNDALLGFVFFLLEHKEWTQ